MSDQSSVNIAICARSPQRDHDVTQFKRDRLSQNSVPRMRFTVAVCALVSMGIVALLTQRLLSSNHISVQLLGMVVVLALGFFGYEWVWVHSSALTRHKRALFDEVNILDTYQPRARTHGHLFRPDPPTPVPNVQFKEGELPQRTDSERASFNASRDAHYADEYKYVMRAAQEQEAIDKSDKAQKVIDKSALNRKQSNPTAEASTKIEFKEPTDDESEHEH